MCPNPKESFFQNQNSAPNSGLGRGGFRWGRDKHGSWGGDMEVVVEVNITMIEVIKVLKHFKMNKVQTQIHYQAQTEIQANYAIIKLNKVKVLKLLTQISWPYKTLMT